jgi:hypothetical protein
MNKIKEENLYLRVLKFWETYPKGFSYNLLKRVVRPNEWENDIIKRYLYNAVLNNNSWNKVLHETIFIEARINSSIPNPLGDSFISMPLETLSEEQIINNAIWENEFILKYDAYFNYIDYLELQKAIENSKEASSQAKLAMYIAISLWIIQIYITK